MSMAQKCTCIDCFGPEPLCPLAQDICHMRACMSRVLKYQLLRLCSHATAGYSPILCSVQDKSAPLHLLYWHRSQREAVPALEAGRPQSDTWTHLGTQPSPGLLWQPRSSAADSKTSSGLIDQTVQDRIALSSSGAQS